MHEHPVEVVDPRADLPRRHPGSDEAVDLAYEVMGNHDKPVLLLIHGGTASRRSWDLVTPALRADFRVIAVDMRGHGQSPAPDSGYSALQLSADINRVIDALALAEITVVGHSLGGMAAIFLAAQRGDVVKRLVLVNVPVTPNTVDPLTSLETRMRQPGFFPVAEAFVDQWAAHARPVPTAFLATQRAHIFKLPPVVWQQVFAELAKADITSTLDAIRQPTLILWGAGDAILDSTQYEKLRSGIRDARLVLIQEAGHNPSSSTPDRVAREIASFAGSVHQG